MAVKKVLSDCSKRQSCVSCAQGWGQHQGADDRASERVHCTEQRILEVTTERSPRGLVTHHLQPAGRSRLLHPGAPQAPSVGSSGVHPGGFGDTGVPGRAPGSVQDQGGRRARAAAAPAGADSGDKARGTAGTKPTYIELGRAALRCKAWHSCPGCLGTHSTFSSRKASPAAGTSWEEPRRQQERQGWSYSPGGEKKASWEKALWGFGCLGKYRILLFEPKLMLA